MILDVIVLSKDNPSELIFTLHSCVTQSLPLRHSLCIKVVDSSLNLLEISSIVEKFKMSFRDVQIVLERLYPPTGIYPAMNYALKNSTSDCLIFMNSGDSFFDDHSLCHLVNEYDKRFKYNSEFRGCFGVTKFSSYSSRLTWTTPPSDPGLLNRWLGVYYPCHQSILFNTNWARNHLYDANRSIDADASVIRALTKDSQLFSFITNTVCIFCLGGGLSSRPMKLRSIFNLLKSPENQHIFTRYLLRYILSPSFLPFNLLPFWTFLRYYFTIKLLSALRILYGK